MENELNLIETELVIDSSIGLHLKETAGWAKFLAIAGFVYSVLIIAGAISAVTLLTGVYDNAGGDNREARIITTAMVGMIYLLIAGVIFLMSFFLFRFSKRALAALYANDQHAFSEAFRHLKVYFRFTGIITAIALVLSVLGLIAVIAAAASRG